MLSIEWTKYSAKDYKKLDHSSQIFVDKAIARIKRDGMQAGTPLRGELAGCNKLKHRSLGLRVVFRKSPGGIQIIQIVAIGRRDKSTVYGIAAKRID